MPESVVLKLDNKGAPTIDIVGAPTLSASTLGWTKDMPAPVAPKVDSAMDAATDGAMRAIGMTLPGQVANALGVAGSAAVDGAASWFNAGWQWLLWFIFFAAIAALAAIAMFFSLTRQ